MARAGTPQTVIPSQQRLFVRIKYRLIEIREPGEFDHDDVPMAGWTVHKNTSLVKNFHRTGNCFVRNQERINDDPE